MFENLSERLGNTLNALRGQGRLTEDNIKESLRDIRMALIEADVSLPVVKPRAIFSRDWCVSSI